MKNERAPSRRGRTVSTEASRYVAPGRAPVWNRRRVALLDVPRRCARGKPDPPVPGPASVCLVKKCIATARAADRRPYLVVVVRLLFDSGSVSCVFHFGQLAPDSRAVGSSASDPATPLPGGRAALFSSCALPPEGSIGSAEKNQYRPGAGLTLSCRILPSRVDGPPIACPCASRRRLTRRTCL